MKIIDAGYEIMFIDLNDPQVVKDIYNRIETIGRVCYKSEASKDGSEEFIKRLIKRGHEAILEHVSLTVKFTVDRGVTHEMVRHRLASYAEESTRFCNYGKDKFGNEITVIKPIFLKDKPEDDREYRHWYCTCKLAEFSYLGMLDEGATAQEARSVLPNSLKADLVMTANIREWRHFLKLRAAGTTGKPHPQMLEVTVPLLNELRMKLPALFEDIVPMEEK